METAVLKVSTDILLAVDAGDLSALVLLNLSAAFDTVDHGIILHRMDSSYQIVGSVHQWFQYYLSNRHVRVGSSSSSPDSMVCGVPQGSVLGAILFLLYFDHVAEWMRSNRLQLNATKTEILCSATSRRLHQLPQAERINFKLAVYLCSNVYMGLRLHTSPMNLVVQLIP